MTGRERLLAALRGDPVDRPPLWLREGFDFADPLPDAADFTLGWRREPDYVELFEFAREHCDTFGNWSPGAHFNRLLHVPPSRMSGTTEQPDADTLRTTTVIDTPKGPLTRVSEQRRGVRTAWVVKEPVETLEDLDKLRGVPFEVEPVNYESYETNRRALGDRGLMCFWVASPWVAFAAGMSFQTALLWSVTERNMVHEILEENTRRALACLEAVFSRDLDTVVVIGGSEQCTPPMMSPDAYAEFVTPYDGRLVAFLKERGCLVQCHCHGKVRRALPEMIKMGHDATDPVEPPPAGDVTMAESREIVGDRMTLLGDFEFDELETATPEHIRRRVREILDTGRRRLILAASAGPISKMTPTLIANYRAWIEEALSYGRA